MSKKTTDQKTEKQAEAKKPVELKDEQLDAAQGGVSAAGEITGWRAEWTLEARRTAQSGDQH